MRLARTIATLTFPVSFVALALSAGCSTGGSGSAGGGAPLGLAGWQAALITNDPDLARATGLRASRQHAFLNGALECRLYRFEPGSEKSEYREFAEPRPLSPAALDLGNRLRKNLRLLKPRLQRAGISCYRAYDADLPDYAAAIDVYEDRLHIQEYQAPKEVPEALARRRCNEIVRVVGEEKAKLIATSKSRTEEARAVDRARIILALLGRKGNSASSTGTESLRPDSQQVAATVCQARLGGFARQAAARRGRSSTCPVR